MNLDIIDEIISEPVGGAHRDKDLILDNVRTSLRNNLEIFSNMNKDEVFMQRKNKFLSIGRTKDFASDANKSESLLMKATVIDILKNKIIQNRNYFLLALAGIFAIIIFLNL